MDLVQVSDEKIYQICKEYGCQALEARRKFIGLLPEVNRRDIWRTRGFGSIFEFAARLAGVSEEQVTEVLRLENKLADKPTLHAQLVNGEISHNKLARVASIATIETDQFWSSQASSLSKAALDTLVKDEKLLQNTLSGQTSLPENLAKLTIDLKPATAQRLSLLKEKGFDLDQLINEMLDQREQNLAAEKARIADTEKVHESEQLPNAKSRLGRYIPVRIRKILLQEYGSKCSIPHCRRAATAIHHTRRFALSAGHNPRYLAPLCREHHQIAHSIDMRFQEVRATIGNNISRRV